MSGSRAPKPATLTTRDGSAASTVWGNTSHERLPNYGNSSQGGVMKTLRGTLFASCALAAFVSFLIADSPANPQLDKLKSLAGNWEGKSTDGKAIHASYKLVPGSTAVAETLSAAGEPDMLTVYHANGGSLMMTHYCSMGNQPRMQADASAGKTIAFHFVDG